MSFQANFPFLKDGSLGYAAKVYQKQVTLCEIKEEQVIFAK